jgi:hypothetical protein
VAGAGELAEHYLAVHLILRTAQREQMDLRHSAAQ